MILDDMSFTRFLLILQQCFEKVLRITSDVFELLITNNILKYCIFLAIAYFVVSIFLDIRDFVPQYLLKKKLEHRDVEVYFDGATETSSDVITNEVTGRKSRITTTTGYKKISSRKVKGK